MSTSSDSGSSADPYDLTRFLQAQEVNYEEALAELSRGRKRTHWMWYTFPQFTGLGSSSISKTYSIKSIDEAKAYLAHPILGPRLLECAELVIRVDGRSATEILGYPDDLKLKSCATLFASLLPPGSVFDRILGKYYGDLRDSQTMRLFPMEPRVG